MGSFLSALTGPLGPLTILAIGALCLMALVGIGYAVYRFVQGYSRRARHDSVDLLLEPQATH